MPSVCTQLLILLVAWLALSTVHSFYSTFSSPRCPPESSPQGCLKPLFAPEEEVDVLVYLTADKRLRWWTERGLEELQKVPLWNATKLRYGDPAGSSSALVPFSAEPLSNVRRNISMLYAHCFLLRSGKRLSDIIRRAPLVPDPGPFSGTLGSDAVHASAPLTRLLPFAPPKAGKNLLSSDSNAAEAEEEEGTKSGLIKRPAVYTTVPGLGKLEVEPKEASMWVGAVFVVGAFLQPRLGVAAVRFCTIAIAMELLRLYQEQEAKFQVLRNERVAEGKQWRPPEETLILPHLIPVVRITLGMDAHAYDARYAPPLLYQEMVFEKGAPMPVGQTDVRYRVVEVPGEAATRRYVPPLAIEHFGLPMKSWRVLDSNASKPDPKVPVELEIKGMILYSVVETVKQVARMYMNIGVSERDLEELKDYIVRHPLHILVIMQVIGFLQVFFSTMAFKNDITFFRGRADYSGLSSRSMATDTLQDIIIFLYLYDYEDISRLVLFQFGVSALIGVWKYARVARLGVHWAYGLPWISHNRGAAGSDSCKEQDTEDIDARGMRYLKFVLYPVSAAWGLYNVYHFHYKSWWSWLISSLADFAYTFGFINMMPQIFINYKLKSVAHMPWRVLMYKFFTTFIDDVFAFFIMADYMTKKHRFMTLRDDVIFFVFLYQRHIYKVDHTRPDEFGNVYLSPEDAAKARAGGPRALGVPSPSEDAVAAAKVAPQSEEAVLHTSKPSAIGCTAGVASQSEDELPSATTPSATAACPESTAAQPAREEESKTAEVPIANGSSATSAPVSMVA